MIDVSRVTSREGFNYVPSGVGKDKKTSNYWGVSIFMYKN